MAVSAGGVQPYLAFAAQLNGHTQIVRQATVVYRVALALILSGNGGQVDAVTIVERQLVFEREHILLLGEHTASAPYGDACPGIPVAVDVGGPCGTHATALVEHHAISHLPVGQTVVSGHVEHTHILVPVVVPMGINLIHPAVLQVGITQTYIQRIAVVAEIDER